VSPPAILSHYKEHMFPFGVSVAPPDRCHFTLPGDRRDLRLSNSVRFIHYASCTCCFKFRTLTRRLAKHAYQHAFLGKYPQAVHITGTPLRQSNITCLPFPFFTIWGQSPMDASTPGEQSDDASSVVEYHGNTSRAYRNQVLAIIGVCRFFSRFVVQGEEQDIEWRT
jgi:hypothetical protein